MAHITRHHLLTGLLLITVLSFGVGISLFYGRLGFMPFDQAPMFDGGWRILSGQIPFRDFTTPAGLTVILMQALFFRLFGISWFVYCLHAAVINGCFGLAAYALLRTAGLRARYAWVYALLSGVVLYPPFGTPYFEQHGFFFLLLAVLFLLKSQTVEREISRAALGILLPVALFCAYLGKQNVALFGLLPLGAAGLCFRGKDGSNRWRMPNYWGLGTFLCAGIIAGYVWHYDIDLPRLFFYFFTLPSGIGGGRLQAIGVDGAFIRPFEVLTPEIVSPMVVLIASVSALAGVPILFSRKASVRTQQVIRGSGRYLVLAGAFTLTCIYFAMSTNNQKENGFPYIFISLGLLHQGLLSVSTSKSFALIRRWGTVFLLVLAVRDAASFNAHVNAARIAHDMLFDANQAVTPTTPELRFMAFQIPMRYYRFTAQQLDAVIDFFRHQDGNFLLMGNTSILYALTKRPSPTPSLWFHEGLTYPHPNDVEAFNRYQDEFMRSLKTYHIRYIVVEDPTLRAQVETFPKFFEFLTSQRLRRYDVGSFQIFELEHPEQWWNE